MMFSNITCHQLWRTYICHVWLEPDNPSWNLVKAGNPFLIYMSVTPINIIYVNLKYIKADSIYLSSLKKNNVTYPFHKDYRVHIYKSTQMMLANRRAFSRIHSYNCGILTFMLYHSYRYTGIDSNCKVAFSMEA